MKKLKPLPELVKTWDLKTLKKSIKNARSTVETYRKERKELSQSQLAHADRMELHLEVYKAELDSRS